MYLSLRGVFMSLSRLWVSSHHSVCTDTHQGVLFSTGPLHWLLLLHRAQTAVVCVWARWGQRGYCYHHARPLKGGCTVHKVCWLTIIPSLSSSSFFLSPWGGDCQPLVNNAAFVMDYQDWENQSRASLCQAACVPVLVFMCLCVCVCVRVGLSSSI